MTKLELEPTSSPYLNGTPEDRAAWVQLCNLQRRILPQVPPDIPGYRLAFAYRPAFVVTGDYHDFFHRPDGLGVFVGDGSGHGPAASMLMAIMRTILRTHDVHRAPCETLAEAGRMFHELTPDDLFMTGLYLTLHPGGRVEWAAAGHHPPLWLNGAAEIAPVEEYLKSLGQVLGISANPACSRIVWQLEPGDRLLLFTDGLVEARDADREKFGRERIEDHLRQTRLLPLDEAVKLLVEKVKLHLDEGEFEDDFTLLGIERLPG